MITAQGSARRRRWADVVVIVASLYSIASSFWAPLELLTGGSGSEVADEGGLWWSYAIGGALGLFALALSRKNPPLAKGLTAAAGLAVLAGFLTLDELTPFAALSIGVTGAALLTAAPFVGPMPSPEDEGKRR